MSSPPREPSSCELCGAPVWLVRTYAPELVPLDAEPNVEGASWEVTWRAAAGELEAHYRPSRNGRNLYRSHYRTCTPPAEEPARLEEARPAD